MFVFLDGYLFIHIYTADVCHVVPCRSCPKKRRLRDCASSSFVVVVVRCAARVRAAFFFREAFFGRYYRRFLGRFCERVCRIVFQN